MAQDRFKNDKEVALAAVASAGHALKYVGKAGDNFLPKNCMFAVCHVDTALSFVLFVVWVRSNAVGARVPCILFHSRVAIILNTVRGSCSRLRVDSLAAVDCVDSSLFLASLH